MTVARRSVGRQGVVGRVEPVGPIEAGRQVFWHLSRVAAEEAGPPSAGLPFATPHQGSPPSLSRTIKLKKK